MGGKKKKPTYRRRRLTGWLRKKAVVHNVLKEKKKVCSCSKLEGSMGGGGKRMKTWASRSGFEQSGGNQGILQSKQGVSALTRWIGFPLMWTLRRRLTSGSHQVNILPSGLSWSQSAVLRYYWHTEGFILLIYLFIFPAQAHSENQS